MIDNVQAYLPHLIELRTRIIRSSLVILALFLGLFLIDDTLYTIIARPLLSQLPAESSMIATAVTTPFTVPMKLAFILACFLAIPYVLYQLWSFLVPGLYTNEKQKIQPFVVVSILLFYSGTTFAYAIICPLALGFFAKCAPVGIKVMTDIQAYLDFVLTILFAGGVAFQVPVITCALIKFNVVSMEKLIHFRPYIIVAAFVLGMLLTPPDVVSQILLALPIWWLFEAGLLWAKYLKKIQPQ
jgi:sec-independent protein translocase protein TatC